MPEEIDILLQALEAADEDVRASALHDLFHVLVANGDRNEHSAYAVPALIARAVNPKQALRVHIVRLLTCIAVSRPPLAPTDFGSRHYELAWLPA